MPRFGDIYAEDTFDGDGDLYISSSSGNYASRAEVVKLRDHLTALLGDGDGAQGGMPAALVAAVKAARRKVCARYMDANGSSADETAQLAVMHALEDLADLLEGK